MPPRVVRCRIPCELVAEERTHRGIAVSISERGLFVQTAAALATDTLLGVRILKGPDRPAFDFGARVARVKRVHPGAQAVVARGMGLELVDPPPEWHALAARLGCGPVDEPPASVDATFGLPCFRVVLRRKDGIRIRTRVVQVACLDAGEARTGVEADVEEGWEIVRIERRRPEGEGASGPRHFRVVAVREGGSRRWESRFDAPGAEEARRAALSELGSRWRIETVEPAAAPPAAGASDVGAAEAPPAARTWQVKVRKPEGARVRTRMAKVEAVSEEEAVRRVLAHLGEGWQAVKVSRL